MRQIGSRRFLSSGDGDGDGVRRDPELFPPACGSGDISKGPVIVCFERDNRVTAAVRVGYGRHSNCTGSGDI